jgi:hypothetical protein
MRLHFLDASIRFSPRSGSAGHDAGRGRQQLGADPIPLEAGRRLKPAALSPNGFQALGIGAPLANGFNEPHLGMEKGVRRKILEFWEAKGMACQDRLKAQRMCLMPYGPRAAESPGQNPFVLKKLRDCHI